MQVTRTPISEETIFAAAALLADHGLHPRVLESWLSNGVSYRDGYLLRRAQREGRWSLSTEMSDDEKEAR
jgi:hypothetical protein